MRPSSIIMMFPSSLFIVAAATSSSSSVLYQTAAAQVEINLQGEELQGHPYHQDTTTTAADMQCGLWLAPSTIEGAGLGMFAGIEYEQGQELLGGGDSVIAIVDLLAHNGHAEYGAFLWDEYTWNGKALKMDSEGYAEVNAASEGFGAAVNCILPIYNVEEWFPINTDLHLHRSADPGAGGSTTFHQRKSTAKRPIAPGEELLVSYGNEWFITRPQLGPIPLEDDLESSSALLKKYTILQETLSKSNISKKIVSDVWATFVKNTTFTDSRVLKGAFRHDNENELEILQEQYKSNMTAARIDGSRRSLDWLRQYGTCGDHIVAGPSRLPQAGMGALARRNLPAGTVVAQLPMIHVTNRTRLDMYQLSVTAENAWVPVNDTVIGHQLLLNYCFGHAESTLLLCPYGPMVNYVNHNQSAANVVLRWGRAETGNHMPALLNGTVQALQESDARAKLAMEMIAVRDIAEGEEILLDYGDEWEAAWNAHVANWKPVADSAAYRSAAQWQGDKTTRLRTVFEELEGKTYPDNIELQCDSALHTDSFECKEQYQEGNLETYLWHNDAAWWPCTVLRYRVGEAGDFLYTVHMFEKAAGGGISNSVLVKDVPRLAFHFVDRPYTSDAFLPNAFRHDIRIPDSIFPQAWRNLRNAE